MGLRLPDVINPSVNPRGFGVIQLVLVIPVIVAGYKFFKVGFKSLIKGSPNMDSLIALGSSAAFFYGIFGVYQIFQGDFKYTHDLYFESAGVILTSRGCTRSKSAYSENGDVISGYFVAVVIILAIGSGAAWLIAGKSAIFSLTIFISVLVIACPCALGLATPTAIMVGTVKGAENKVKESTSLAKHTQGNISGIMKGIELLSGKIKEIYKHTIKQSESTEKVASTIKNVIKNAENISKSTQNVNDNVNEQIAVIEEIGATSSNLYSMTEKLNKLIEYFKI